MKIHFHDVNVRKRIRKLIKRVRDCKNYNHERAYADDFKTPLNVAGLILDMEGCKPIKSEPIDKNNSYFIKCPKYVYKDEDTIVSSFKILCEYLEDEGASVRMLLNQERRFEFERICNYHVDKKHRSLQKKDVIKILNRYLHDGNMVLGTLENKYLKPGEFRNIENLKKLYHRIKFKMSDREFENMNKNGNNMNLALIQSVYIFSDKDFVIKNINLNAEQLKNIFIYSDYNVNVILREFPGLIPEGFELWDFYNNRNLSKSHVITRRSTLDMISHFIRTGKIRYKNVPDHGDMKKLFTTLVNNPQALTIDEPNNMTSIIIELGQYKYSSEHEGWPSGDIVVLKTDDEIMMDFLDVDYEQLRSGSWTDRSFRNDFKSIIGDSNAFMKWLFSS